MKKEEEIAENYLKSLNYKNVVFEPNGNIPPDFLIDGRIAVEVRRLNQTYFKGNKLKGLEEDRIRLFGLLESDLLSKFDAQYKGSSYLISIELRGRPIGTAKTVRKPLCKFLTDFLSNPASLPSKVKLTEKIYLHVYSIQPVKGKVFLFAGGTDRESGGFVISEFIKNFDRCVKDKSEKIKNYYYKYNSWWLVLVDQVFKEFNEDEIKYIKSKVSVNSCWDKVIILESLNGNNIMEI